MIIATQDNIIADFDPCTMVNMCSDSDVYVSSHHRQIDEIRTRLNKVFKHGENTSDMDNFTRFYPMPRHSELE